ncbi:putative N-acetylated-alpha-linked acidic dipeptidase [Branchiostoma floridae x Branchiostoma belcheri]
MAEHRGVRKRPFILLGVACAVVGLVLGIIIGFFAIPRSGTPWSAALTREGDPSVPARLQRELKPDNIRENLRTLTARPHIAGKEMDLGVARLIRDRWLEYGFDSARLVPYDVLLAYPSRDPNRLSGVSLLEADGTIVVESQQQEAGISDPEAEPPFNAYSASGELQGDLVYVNFARAEDFQTLVRDLGVDPTGKICIARYGKIFRGNKAKLAAQFGCAGLVLYSDPEQCVAAGWPVWPDGWMMAQTFSHGRYYGHRCYATEVPLPRENDVRVLTCCDRLLQAKLAAQFGCAGLVLYSDPEQCVAAGWPVWPDGWMMPSTGVQRGNVKDSTWKGDSLTPFYPANEYAYRLDDQDANLSAIPVHPISYGVAVEILRNMAGPEAPVDWQGGLDITYHLGPGYTGPASSRTVRLVVNQDREVRTTYNVIGTIRGAVEPDRYVIVGNHHDAWVYGSVDPSSGTAVMLELGRALGKLKAEGWRPRRTLVFGSWGAEEQGLIGSTEFVEDYIRSLQERTVAYLNCDSAAAGNFSIAMWASPTLHSLIREAAKKVPDPHEPSKSLYDTWRLKRPEEEGNPDTRPKIGRLGSGTDFTPFFQHAGITALDMWNHIDPAFGFRYPLYHSAYETFDLQDRFIDPDWTVHQSVGRLWGEMAVTLADALVLPLDVRDYAETLQKMMDELRDEHGSRLAAQNIGLDHLESAIANFTRATTTFHQSLGTVDKSNPLAVRAVNDRLMKLEGAFIDPLGLPDRPWYRHVAFAPSSLNTYAGQSFPGLADALFDIDNVNPADQAARWELVRRQLAVTTFTVQSAANTLVNNLF